MTTKIKYKSTMLWFKKVLICTVSLIILGIGCGINVVSNQGADPITVFYDGLSIKLGISVGLTAGILNTLLVVAVFFIKRKYINIGTLIYIFILGIFIDFGIWSYNLMGIPNEFIWQLSGSLVGCVLCFVGLGGFMSIDIGIDPWTALALLLCEKTNKSFRLIKVILDVLTLGLGWLMGGTIGIITLFCAVVGGPIIQKSAEVIDKMIHKMLKSNYESPVKTQ